MSEAVDRFKEHWWMRAWAAAIAAGNKPFTACDYADRCLKEFEKRFEQEKVDER